MKGLMRALSDLYDQGMMLKDSSKGLHAASEFALYAAGRLEHIDGKVDEYVNSRKTWLEELNAKIMECETEMEAMLPFKDRLARRKYSALMSRIADYEERRNSVVSELERSARLLRRR
jgi:hypothetical protein